MDWRKLPRPYRRTGKMVKCLQCGKIIYRPKWQLDRYPRSFCCRTCANKFKGRADQKWDINFDFFVKWTPKLAYLIGLLITDGNVRETGQISFVSKDKELTEFVRNCITPSQPIRKERTRNNSIVWRWNIWSIPLFAILQKFGLIPRKSKIVKFPIIPPEVQWHFIRGILDGDGTIGKIGRIGFSSGSKDFAVGLKNFLIRNDLSPHFYQATRSFCVYLGVKDSIKLAYLIYQNNFFCLQRKKLRARI